MMYSSAIFKNKSQSLHHASLNKLEIICKKLQLKRTDHIIEIGTGWAGFAIYAAEKYGCRVTTTTIPRQQYNFAKELIKKKMLTKQRVNAINQAKIQDEWVAHLPDAYRWLRDERYAVFLENHQASGPRVIDGITVID